MNSVVFYVDNAEPGSNLFSACIKSGNDVVRKRKVNLIQSVVYFELSF